jgi:glycerol-3-phosphate acyltransferase PlsY
MIRYLSLVFASYILGSIPPGFIIAKAYDIDLRKIGSGNIGGTNVARALGKKMGGVVILLDALKGFIPTIVARIWWEGEEQGIWWVCAVGLAAFLGHIFSLFLRFKGGKGVATSFGVIVALCPLAAISALVVYIILFLLFRISSLGSLGGTLSAVLFSIPLAKQKEYIILIAILAIFIYIRHLDNIKRLITKSEGRI